MFLIGSIVGELKHRLACSEVQMRKRKSKFQASTSREGPITNRQNALSLRKRYAVNGAFAHVSFEGDARNPLSNIALKRDASGVATDHLPNFPWPPQSAARFCTGVPAIFDDLHAINKDLLHANRVLLRFLEGRAI